jgi:hypothetical protein
MRLIREAIHADTADAETARCHPAALRTLSRNDAGAQFNKDVFGPDF